MTDPSTYTAATEEAAQRIRALTEQYIEAAKKGGNAALDAWVKALENVIEWQQQAANATQIDWINAAAQAQAKFFQDYTNLYVSAARDMLK